MSLGSLFGTYQSLLNNATGVLSISGTPLQIAASGSYTTSQVGDIVLSLPQNIDTTSSPTFAGLTLSGLSAGILGVNSSGTFYSNSVSAPLSYDSVSHILSLNYNNNLRNNAGYLDVVASPTFSGVTSGSLTLTGYNGVLKATAGSISAVTLTSDDITEGKTNLYYTNARARGAISTAGNPLAYNSGTGLFTFQYNTTSLKLTGGALNTIQDLNTASYVTFGQVTSAFVGNLTGTASNATNAVNATNATNAVNSTYANAIATAGTTSQYYRGDNSWQTLNQAAISGLTTASSPTFAGMTLTGYNGVIKSSAGVLSGSATTSDLTEGSNLYFTDARARSAVGIIGASTPINVAAGYIGLNYTSNFTMSGSNLDTIQNIKTTSDVLFNSLTLGSTLAGAYNNLQGSYTSAINTDAIGTNISHVLSTTTTNRAMYGLKVLPTCFGAASYTGTVYGIHANVATSGVAANTAYSGYFVAPSSGTNKCALYASDLNVGVTAGSSPVSGQINCNTVKFSTSISPGIQQSLDVYTYETVSTTWNLDATHTTTANIRYCRVGYLVCVVVDNFVLAYNGSAPYPYCTPPGRFAPVRNQPMPTLISNNGASAVMGCLYINTNPNLYIRSSTFGTAYVGTGFNISTDPAVCLTGTYYLN